MRIDYDCVKEIAKALRKKYKMTSKSYGYCCMTDYFDGRESKDNYVCAKIFKGGLNNQYHKDSWGYGGYFELGSTVYWLWELPTISLDDVCATMQEIAVDWGYIVIKPESDSTCITLTCKE